MEKKLLFVLPKSEENFLTHAKICTAETTPPQENSIVVQQKLMQT